MNRKLFSVAKSGWKYIASAFFATLLFWILDFDFLTLLSFTATLLFVFFFRNPQREALHQQNSIAAPCDGVVTAIETLEESPYSYRIDIESSYADVGVLRAPMDARVLSLKHTSGTHLSKSSKLFRLLNESAEVLFVDSAENEILVTHRVKQSFAPVDITLLKEQRVVQSADYGFMIDGVISIYFKSNCRLDIDVGQEVKASESLIAYFS
jgi:phosphatidylserine decarboxylase